MKGRQIRPLRGLQIARAGGKIIQLFIQFLVGSRARSDGFREPVPVNLCTLGSPAGPGIVGARPDPPSRRDASAPSMTALTASGCSEALWLVTTRS